MKQKWEMWEKCEKIGKIFILQKIVSKWVKVSNMFWFIVYYVCYTKKSLKLLFSLIVGFSEFSCSNNNYTS